MSNVIDLNSQLQTPVAVLFGGRSAERDVSLQSGEAVLAALRGQNIPVEPIDSKDNDWLERVANNHRHAFIALHGGDGEDGTIQGALENLDISYTGSGVTASALAMDKVRCKYLWQGMDLPTPQFAELNDDSDLAEIIQQFGKVIVKPSCEGSSIGMTIATTAEELSAAYIAAKAYDDSVMVEQWVQGAEFTVAILGGRALPAIRLETDHGFYDYDAKYIADDTRYICPCGLDKKLEQQLQELALAAFTSVGCEGWGRVDVMQDEQGNFYLLEVNTVPGMTGHSLVPMAAKAAGISFEQLVTEILTLSLNK
ncbi:MAG: D-alanine--D-alanine ligase [Oceanicoccus sp.]|uniref:D-alanine--D-alanine ligase n=1 Tax=Oceanicoccus sp. TaxID=2691044 RepID=UPI002633612A|nr:D-alanine--D-alanine ligase [Oceanicoccus sp.]MDG1773185.1 D-alanine--D-alanine ligase [Oceanicoccus sp.]